MFFLYYQRNLFFVKHEQYCVCHKIPNPLLIVNIIWFSCTSTCKLVVELSCVKSAQHFECQNTLLFLFCVNVKHDLLLRYILKYKKLVLQLPVWNTLLRPYNRQSAEPQTRVSLYRSLPVWYRSMSKAIDPRMEYWLAL